MASKRRKREHPATKPGKVAVAEAAPFGPEAAELCRRKLTPLFLKALIRSNRHMPAARTRMLGYVRRKPDLQLEMARMAISQAEFLPDEVRYKGPADYVTDFTPFAAPHVRQMVGLATAFANASGVAAEHDPDGTRLHLWQTVQEKAPLREALGCLLILAWAG